MTSDSGVDVAATLPGRFTRSQGSVGSDIGNNQLETTTQHSIGSDQGSEGIAPYIPLSGGLGGSPAEIGNMSNSLGSGANVPMDPYPISRVSGGVQVRLSLLPSVCRSDQPDEHRQCPRPNPRPTVLPSTTPKQ